MQVAAPIRLAVLRRHVERAHRHRHAVRKAHEHPGALVVFVPVRLAAHELAVRRIDAVPVLVQNALANAADFGLLADFEFDRAPGASRLLRIVVLVASRRHEHLVGTVRRPVEVGARPAVLEAAPQLRTVAVDREGSRVPVGNLVRDLVEPVDGAGEEEDLLAILRDDRVAVVGERLPGLARDLLGLGLLRTRSGDGENQFRLARLEVHRPKTIVLGPRHRLARVLSRSRIAVVGAQQRQAGVVDGNGPRAVLRDGAHRHWEDTDVLARLPVHDHGLELAVPQVVEEDRVVVHPERHRRLLEIPARRRGHGDELVAVLKVDDAERAALARLRQTTIDIRFENQHVPLVRTPRIDREVAREEVLVRTGRHRARLAPLRERRQFLRHRTSGDQSRRHHQHQFLHLTCSPS